MLDSVQMVVYGDQLTEVVVVAMGVLVQIVLGTSVVSVHSDLTTVLVSTGLVSVQTSSAQVQVVTGTVVQDVLQVVLGTWVLLVSK